MSDARQERLSERGDDRVIVALDKDEWYPVYSLEPAEKYNDSWHVKVTESFWNRYTEVTAAFNTMQEELRKLEHDND